MYMSIVKKLYTILLALLLVAVFNPITTVKAAALTSVSDTLSTLTESTVANHTIVFTTPTGVAAGETIAITFPASFTDGLNGVDFGDMDLNDGGEITLAAVCSGASWGAAVDTDTVTFTSCTDAISAASTVTVEIGLNASGGNTQIVNPVAADDLNMDIAGTMVDSGSLAISIISDDSIGVTASVDPTITFTITEADMAIGFGTLSDGAARYATGDGNGNAAEIEAHTMGCSTNADNGYSITINGTTLTSGGNTIDAIGAVNSAYLAGGFAFDTASFPDEVAAASGPSTATTYSVRYLANISSTTEAGSYATTLTYIATATF
jgi:hypothetical protein